MAIRQHRHDMYHRLRVPVDQVAGGTATPGFVPVADGAPDGDGITGATWTDPATLVTTDATLAEVLVNGNDPDGTYIKGADAGLPDDPDTGAYGANSQVGGAASLVGSTASGGWAALGAGDAIHADGDDLTQGGGVSLRAGTVSNIAEDTFADGPAITLLGAQADSGDVYYPGNLFVYDGESFGTDGQVLTSRPYVGPGSGVNRAQWVDLVLDGGSA